MRPKTKVQKEISLLSKKIPPITDKQKDWGISRSYTQKERNENKRIYRYFVISFRLKKWQVCRFFQVRKIKQEYFVIEPVRLWFDERGTFEIEAMNRFCFSGAVDSWVFNSELSFKKVPVYGDYTVMLPISASKITSKLPLLSRNGLKYSFNSIQPRDVIKGLLANNTFETLWKCKQFSLLRALTYGWGRRLTREDKASIIRIILRHNYIVKDADLWLDMIELLKRANKDIRNPKFICPESVKKAHEQALEWCNKYEEKQRKIEDRKKLLEDKRASEKYQSERLRFAGMVISNGNVEIKVLPTVEDVMNEGNAMHHCVFASEYYKRLDSLLLTAKVNGERAETIEVDLKRYKLVQSRGICNNNSEYHNEIISLINENMNVIRKFNNIVK